MNDTLQHFGAEGETRVLSEEELEALMETIRERVARWPSRVLSSSRWPTGPRVFKLSTNGRKVTCPPDILIPIVMAEIEYRKSNDSEWDEESLNGQHRRICISRAAGR